MEKPDVVVGTPSRVLAHISARNLVLHSSLEMLVVDEADLLFSFGFEADLKNLLWWELADRRVLVHLPPLRRSWHRYLLRSVINGLVRMFLTAWTRLCSSSQSSAKDLPVVPDVCYSHGGRSGLEGAAAAQPCKVLFTFSVCGPLGFCLNIWCRVASGDPEAAGLAAPRQQPAAAVQHPVWGGGQVPAHLHAAEAATGAGKDAAVRGNRGEMLQTQTVPGTVRYSCLRAQLGAARPVQVYICIQASWCFRRIPVISLNTEALVFRKLNMFSNHVVYSLVFPVDVTSSHSLTRDFTTTSSHQTNRVWLIPQLLHRRLQAKGRRKTPQREDSECAFITASVCVVSYSCCVVSDSLVQRWVMRGELDLFVQLALQHEGL